jgi:hypothetical protein
MQRVMQARIRIHMQQMQAGGPQLSPYLGTTLLAELLRRPFRRNTNDTDNSP